MATNDEIRRARTLDPPEQELDKVRPPYGLNATTAPERTRLEPAYKLPATSRRIPAGTTFVQTYATADPTLGAYTPDVENVDYLGLNNAQVGTVYAPVNSLNALRAAVENLRVFVEDQAKFLNALVDELQAQGVVG